MPLFAENARHQRGNLAIGRATMKLSMADYLVVHTATGKGEKPSIQIDRAYEGPNAENYKTTDHAGKIFGSCDLHDCRVYWEVRNANEDAA
jgi:hypothetical protein